jgi:hypothetical protein
MVTKFWTELKIAANETNNCQYASQPEDVGRKEDMTEGTAYLIIILAARDEVVFNIVSPDGIRVGAETSLIALCSQQLYHR